MYTQTAMIHQFFCGNGRCRFLLVVVLLTDCEFVTFSRHNNEAMLSAARQKLGAPVLEVAAVGPVTTMP